MRARTGRDETSLRVGCLQTGRRVIRPACHARHERAGMVWYDFDKWDNKVQNTVGYQIIRSSDSISANLAEGYGRYTPADRKKFYLYSRGSLEETKSWLRKLIRRKVLNESTATEYKAIVEKLGPKLNALSTAQKHEAKFQISIF